MPPDFLSGDIIEKYQQVYAERPVAEQPTIHDIRLDDLCLQTLPCQHYIYTKTLGGQWNKSTGPVYAQDIIKMYTKIGKKVPQHLINVMNQAKRDGFPG